MGKPHGTNGVKISTRFCFAGMKLRFPLGRYTERRIILKRILGWEAWAGLIWLIKWVRSRRLWIW